VATGLIWPRVDGSENRLYGQQSLNANKRFAICGAIIATARPRAAGSTRSASAAGFLKHAFVSTIRTCEMAIRFSPSSIRRPSPRSGTALMRASYMICALQNRLYDCTKFDKLVRYRCANLFFLVLPEQLFREPEIPAGWGALVESDGVLTLVRKPIWHETTTEDRVRLLQRIAIAGTRVLNQKLEIGCDGVDPEHR